MSAPSLDVRSTSYKAALLASYISRQHARVRASHSGRPLMVSMQGPQGAGKSTLASALQAVLADEPYSLRSAVASMDDFYLTRRALDQLAADNPHNQLLSGRGPPGTHDLPLLCTVLADIRNSGRSLEASKQVVHLPIFDKALFAGRGDRSSRTLGIDPGALDVFILEGWSLGFRPLESSPSGKCGSNGEQKGRDILRDKWLAGRTASAHPFSTIQQINRNLVDVYDATHSLFDAHISIKLFDYNYVYSWRLQQEQHMKSLNGGVGQSDEEIEKFVGRYMPCYELYGDSKGTEEPVLSLTFGREREVLNIEETEAANEGS